MECHPNQRMRAFSALDLRRGVTRAMRSGNPFLGLGIECEHSLLSTCVGVTGFEPATSSSRTKRATKLRHTPRCEKHMLTSFARVGICFECRQGVVIRPEASVVEGQRPQKSLA